MGSQTPDLCRNIIFENQLLFNFNVFEAWTWGKVQGDKNMVSDKFDDWEDEGLSPKKTI